MAKLLVLVDGADEEVVTVGEAVREGARSVRFAEADLLRLPGAPGSVRIARIGTLDDAATLAAYDAVVIGGSGDGHAAFATLLDAGPPGALANTVGSVLPALEDPMGTGERHPLWPLLARMAARGMILVPPGYGGPSGHQERIDDAARRLGKRLVDVAGWITHARSHHHHH